MKIEKINDNQIRAVLSSEDLHARNLDIKELAYGSPKARKLFTDLMKKAREEVGFDSENLPLMIEAIPLPDNCLVMVVTKVAEPEELDTRFSRFSSNPDELSESSDNRYKDLDSIMDNLEDIMANGFGTAKAGQAGSESGSSSDNVWKIRDNETFDEMISDETETPFEDLFDHSFEEPLEDSFESSYEYGEEEDLENAHELTEEELFDNPFMSEDQDLPFSSGPEDNPDTLQGDPGKEIPLNDLMAFLKAEIKARKEADTKGSGKNTRPPRRKKEFSLYSFSDLDQVIAYANFVSPFYDGPTSLYKAKGDGTYKLLMANDGGIRDLFLRACNIAADFGVKIPVHYGTPAYLKEHCSLLLEGNALDELKGF